MHCYMRGALCLGGPPGGRAGPQERFSGSGPSFLGCGAPHPFPGSSDLTLALFPFSPSRETRRERGQGGGLAPQPREASGAPSPEPQPPAGEALASPPSPPPCARWLSWALYHGNLLAHPEPRPGQSSSARAGPPGSVVLGLESVSTWRIRESPKASYRAPRLHGLATPGRGDTGATSQRLKR